MHFTKKLKIYDNYIHQAQNNPKYGIVNIAVIYRELQSDVITSDAVFIREGNFHFQNMLSFSWNTRNEEDVKVQKENFHELMLVFKSKDFFYKVIRGEKNFEVTLHVKNEDVDCILRSSNSIREKVELSLQE